MPLNPASTRDEDIRVAREWIETGNTHRSRGREGLGEAMASYDKAAGLISPHCDSDLSPFRDDLASAWINRGIALMNYGEFEALKQSIGCFDRAIELRATLLGLDGPWFRYNLVGVWINRGDALSRFGDEASRDAALASYEKALDVGRGMESDSRPKVSWRLALAHLNRGATLMASGKDSGLAEAGRSFDAAIALLANSEGSQRLIGAYAWEGKAEVLGRQGDEAQARHAARRAMDCVAGLEPGALDAAIVGLKARIALCANSWRMLQKRGESVSEKAEMMEALDAADEGLRLAFGWPASPQIQSLIVPLFRFASLGYAAFQPQFLGEFISDFIKPTTPPELAGALRPLAVQAVRNAIGKLADAGLQKAGLTETEVTMFAGLRMTLEDLERAGS